MFGAVVKIGAFVCARIAAQTAAPVIIARTASAIGRRSAVHGARVIAKRSAVCAISRITATETAALGGVAVLGGKMLYDSHKSNNNPKALRARAAQIEENKKEEEAKKAEEKQKAQSKKMQKMLADEIASGSVSDEKVKEIIASLALSNS